MKSFSKIPWLDFPKSYIQSIINEITSKGKDYILKVDENEYINYLFEKYRLEPLKILYQTEEVSLPTKSTEILTNRFGREYMSDSWTFRINYNFKGSPILFSIRPNPFSYNNYHITIDRKNHIVSFYIKIYNQNIEEFKKVKSDCYSKAFTNLDKVNDHIIQFSVGFEKEIERLFFQEKNKYKEENDFFAAINISVNKNTESIFSVPTIKKKIIKQPSISKIKSSTQFLL